jgi:NO-binding membrane sensor protein with MHYT domain
MHLYALLALSRGWADSFGLLFTFAVLMPAIATICIVVSIISGRGDKKQDDKNAGRWGRQASSDSAE